MKDNDFSGESYGVVLFPGLFLPGFLEAAALLSFSSSDAATNHGICLPRCNIDKMPSHPFQRQAGSKELEEVDGPRTVVIKWKVFLFASNSGSSHCTESLVVTLKIIRQL